MNNMVLRVTPLTVLADIDPALSLYRGLGFEVMETGNAGCVGLRAGDTYLILATTAHMAGQFQPAAVDHLTGHTIPYLHVQSLEEALMRLPATAAVIERTLTPHGTAEALVEDAGQCMILAEKHTPDA
jgi:ethanolamine utilization microcompartment shell protein EutS